MDMNSEHPGESVYTIKANLDKSVQEALDIMESRFKQFMRNGRWGTCIHCPTDKRGFSYPEFCIHTDRYDHFLDIEKLAQSYLVVLKYREEINNESAKS